MKKLVFIAWFQLINVCSTEAFQTSQITVNLPSHPRLFIQQREVATIRKNFDHADFMQVVVAYKLQKAFETNGISGNGLPDERIRQKMEAYALEYLLFEKSESGKEAIDLALAYLPSITSASDYWNNIYAYEAVIGVAMVYDWCYSLLAPAQKDTLVYQLKRVLSLTEYGYPVTKERSYFTSHYGEHGPTALLAAGLAIYDEDKDMFNFAYNEQNTFFAPSRNAWSNAGTHHQGSQYMHTRLSQELVQAFILEKTGLQLYDIKVCSLAYRAPYLTIPQKVNMNAMPDGDLHWAWDWSKQFYAPAANLSNDPFLQNLSIKHLVDNLNQSARLFIYHNPIIKSESIQHLPLTRFFPSPSGIMIARTKWDFDSSGFNSNALVVQMNMKEYHTRNHDHLDAGHFSIYYKGHLAIDAGAYQGWRSNVQEPDLQYGSPHHRNYYQRTVAHNSLLIVDPAEPIPLDKNTSARDGGQFPFNNGEWNATQEMIAAGKPVSILAHDIAEGMEPDYSYLKGDMTNAYNVPDYINKDYPDKVVKVRRSFVFLNHHSSKVPGTLIVLDAVVAANPSFKKKWLLHTEDEPLILRNNIIINRTDSGRNGRLYTTVLLPELSNQQIEKIGGSGKEYWVDGKNWGSTTFTDVGHWRVELSPKREAVTDNFLNVIQVMDAKPAPKPFKLEKTFSTDQQFVAIALDNRIVVQRLDLDKKEGEIEFTIGKRNKAYKVLVTDIYPGKWQVISPTGIIVINVNATAENLYFVSRGGRFQLKRIY